MASKWAYLSSIGITLIAAFFVPEVNVRSDPSFPNTLSWWLLGFWLVFTLAFLSNIKRAYDFASAHNTLFFLWGGLLISLFYSFWGNYTTLLSSSVYFLTSEIYINIWILVFALPYWLYGHKILLNCFLKYYAVYLRRSPLNSKTIGFFTIIINSIFLWVAIWNPSHLIIGLDQNVTPDDILAFQNSQEPNLLLWGSLILHGLFLIYGLVKQRPASSTLNANTLSSQISAIDNSLRSADRLTANAQSRERQARDRRAAQKREQERREADSHNRRREQQREQQRRDDARREEQRRQAQQREKQRIAQRHVQPQRSSPSVSVSRPQSSGGELSRSELERLKPKTGVLSQDDFKCIFCFKIPTLPADQHRDIVVCPHCHYPAHLDEFHGWTKNSRFCSRCEQDLGRARTNPDRVPTTKYVKAMKQLLKK